jgi:small subunit ribosomal protein S6
LSRASEARGVSLRHLQEQDLATSLRDYELVVILNPEIGDDVISESLERLNQGVTGRGGEVVEVNHWGRRRLAYPISRHFEGNYVVSQIKLDPTEVPAFEGILRISEEVIRHLIVKADE